MAPFPPLLTLAPYVAVLLLGALIEIVVGETAAIVFLAVGAVALILGSPVLKVGETIDDARARRTLTVAQYVAFVITIFAATLADDDVAIAVAAVTLVVASLVCRAVAAAIVNRR